MKSFRCLLLSLLCAGLTVALPAQTKPAAVVKPVETARIAYLNSNLFLDESAGIKQLVKVTKSLQNEFAVTDSELSLLNEKLRTIAGEMNRLQADPVANAKALGEKQAAGLKLQQELQQKQQQAQATFSQRQQEVQGPVAADIGKEVRAFAKERDISLLFDLAKLGDGVLDARPELDMTADFIAYFNAKHP